ncbi:hypothetical protein APHCRT_0711 [Anaplasma phagocytophilum str. CRT53-1]|uniref:Uncharacterized protein n=1 Tax=Anaplasma phagocytophilum str. CRT53-1 TaxID=1359157 RepID=A0A0F3Q0J6_ANAPH|nr:hypothetical protein APHCRT_0711 [Anaplasma phagocytophilum str. CRT53-1]
MSIRSSLPAMAAMYVCYRTVMGIWLCSYKSWLSHEVYESVFSNS